MVSHLDENGLDKYIADGQPLSSGLILKSKALNMNVDNFRNPNLKCYPYLLSSGFA